MSEDFEPFVEVQLEVLFCGRSQETAAPAPTTAVGNGTSDSAPRREEEEVDVWVHLGNDGKVGVEMEIQSFEGYISP